jgi:hypothetical protein
MSAQRDETVIQLDSSDATFKLSHPFASSIVDAKEADTSFNKLDRAYHKMEKNLRQYFKVSSISSNSHQFHIVDSQFFPMMLPREMKTRFKSTMKHQHQLYTLYEQLQEPDQETQKRQALVKLYKQARGSDLNRVYDFAVLQLETYENISHNQFR